MNIFGFRRSVPSESPAQVTDRLLESIKTASKVEDIRASINSLYDLVTGDQLHTLSIPLCEGLLRVIADYNKEDVGLLTSALAIFGALVALGPQSFEYDLQDAFVRSGGIEAMVEVLTARHLLASTGTGGTRSKC